MSGDYEAAKRAVMQRYSDLPTCEHCKSLAEEFIRNEIEGALCCFPRASRGVSDTQENQP